MFKTGTRTLGGVVIIDCYGRIALGEEKLPFGSRSRTCRTSHATSF
jgi:hypothetical protein